MMNKSESEFIPGFWRSYMSSVKGNRTRHRITMNPNKANPQEEIYMDVPKLKMDSCSVPDSFHLLLNFKVSNTKSTFMD